MAYHSILIQKMQTSADVKDVQSDYGIYCKEFPFKVVGNPKELAHNDWHDEDGDDEYVPPTLYMEAYDIEVDFAVKGTLEDTTEELVVVEGVRNRIKNFINYLLGRDSVQNPCAEFKIYDSYTGIGRQHVRVKSISDDVEFSKYNENIEGVITEKCYAIFKVTFKVNDPVTDITLSTT